LPRKYRPPAARRRKAKRQAPVFVEPLPDSGNEPAAIDGADAGVFEDAESEMTVTAAEPRPVPAQARPADRPADRPSPGQVKHIAKDYSYVRAEVRRIALVGGFLVVSLIITAILRN
jgi:hypothetical protein